MERFGWLKVGAFYLPMAIKGATVAIPVGSKVSPDPEELEELGSIVGTCPSTGRGGFRGYGAGHSCERHLRER